MLSQEEIKRYSRHLILPDVALAGQKKLKKAKVLLVGMGGLGSPVAMYLAAAGIGHLGLIDFDVVEHSNLQRQIIYNHSDVGKSKLKAASEHIANINPHVCIQTHETRISAQNALDICSSYDIIIDGTDNFPTRYLVNDACVFLKKPNIYGSIFRFEGQMSVFYPGKGPCYRCLYPSPPAADKIPSCAEGGVLGVLPGIVGVVQATEAIKLILDKGKSLVGRLLLFDALQMEFRELKLRQSSDCPICGENPSITELVEYQQTCPAKLEQEWEISVAGLQKQINSFFILDVREPHEFEICRLPGSKLIPLSQLQKRIGELPKQQTIIVHCRSGGRSQKALELLRQQGFSNVKNLQGGILAWAQKIDPTMPTY